MPKQYLVIFGILLAVPVVAAVAVVSYCCFKVSTVAGFIALGVCLIAAAIVVGVVIYKIKKGGADKQ